MTTPKERLRTLRQSGAYASPWPLKTRLALALWAAAWRLLYRPTPKFLYPWRVFLLRMFGADVKGHVFVSESARIRMPWNLELNDRSAVGECCEIYNLAPVRLGPRATLAQHVYLCGGTHNLEKQELPLVVGPIEVCADAFVGARAFVMPGVRIGAGAVVGAGSVVTRDMEDWMVCAGNPCRALHPRKFDARQAEVSGRQWPSVPP